MYRELLRYRRHHLRLAPVALRWWHDPVTLGEIAERQSATTHRAPEALSASRAFAKLLAQAIAGAPRSAVLAPHPCSAYPGAIGPIMAGSWHAKPRHAIRSTGYVAHSLEAALWAIARTTSFRDAVLPAANLGGDADTIAAITGQLAGALYGARAIPQQWRSLLAWNERLTQTAQTLITARTQDRNQHAVARRPLTEG